MTSATVAAKTAASSGKPEKIRKDHNINWWLTAAVAVLSLTVLVPLYFTVVTALKTPGEAGTFTLPTSWEWHNFADAWNKVNYPKAALNSAIITVCAVVLTLLTNTFVAYAVARNMDKRFFRFLYYFFLAMMFVPFTVIMLPIAKEMGSLHLDNQLGLIVLYTILGIGTNLFIAIGFIRSIPVSLEEA
ncbi:carbohydrate ABC transporter permease, partial [Bifidobacterium dentium]